MFLSHDVIGREYYHVCPPLSEPEWGALPPLQRARKQPGDERENKRDENVAVDQRGRRLGLRAEGDGVDDLEEVTSGNPRRGS